VLCGEHDQVTPVTEMRQMAEAIPGAAFQSFPGAGHLCHLEAPPGFEHAVIGFLEALSSKATS
jgi:pimeloyl-ACP methyl ester carboxylesterase